MNQIIQQFTVSNLKFFAIFSSCVLFFIFLNTTKNKVTQTMINSIKLQITIDTISPFLSWSVSIWHVRGSSDDFRTLKDPNVSFEYVKYVIIKW